MVRARTLSGLATNVARQNSYSCASPRLRCEGARDSTSASSQRGRDQRRPAGPSRRPPPASASASPQRRQVEQPLAEDRADQEEEIRDRQQGDEEERDAEARHRRAPREHPRERDQRDETEQPGHQQGVQRRSDRRICA
jgi:hypothetical protein